MPNGSPVKTESCRDMSPGDAISRSHQRLVPVEDDQLHHDRRSGVPSVSMVQYGRFEATMLVLGLYGRIEYIYAHSNTIILYNIYIYTYISPSEFPLGNGVAWVTDKWSFSTFFFF